MLLPFGADHGCKDTSHCCTGYAQPNDSWLYNSMNQFSAACWHFAEHLTDIAESKNESVVPFGLIGSRRARTLNTNRTQGEGPYIKQTRRQRKNTPQTNSEF